MFCRITQNSYMCRIHHVFIHLMNIYGESTVGRSGVIFHFPVTHLMIADPRSGQFSSHNWLLSPCSPTPGHPLFTQRSVNICGWTWGCVVHMHKMGTKLLRTCEESLWLQLVEVHLCYQMLRGWFLWPFPSHLQPSSCSPYSSGVSSSSSPCGHLPHRAIM